jgi:hypothetical protein
MFNLIIESLVQNQKYAPVTQEEISQAIKYIKKGKSADYHGLTIEHILFSGNNMINYRQKEPPTTPPTRTTIYMINGHPDRAWNRHVCFDIFCFVPFRYIRFASRGLIWVEG